MPLLPSEVPTRLVTASMYFVNEDSVDPDTNPEYTVVTGSVVFTASPKVIRMASKPAIIVPLKFEAVFDAEGQLIPKNGTGVGLELIVTDSTLLNPRNWTWTCTFNLKVAGTQNTVNIESFSFQLPEGPDPIDLVQLMPVAASNGVLTIQGSPGSTGESAYATAVKQGFLGTEEAWLASLKGPKGDPGPGGGVTDASVAAVLEQPLTKAALNGTYATKAEAAAGGGSDASHFITDPTLAKSGTPTLQAIPTYDGSGVVVHPSVYFNPEGWNGWKYWMAMTPYANSDVTLENPSVVVSNDGNNWIVPAGLTNPIEPAPPGSPANGYNSDPFLTVASDGKMYLFWRAFTGQENIFYRTSTDGVTWSAKVLSRTASPAVDRLVSPSLIQQTDGAWVMYAVNIVPSPRRIVRTTAPTPSGPWSPLENCTVTGNAGDPWHLDAHKVGGEIQMLVQDGGSGGGDLWAAVSSDGLTFKAGAKLIERGTGWQAGYYKSCFIPAVSGGLAGWDAWIGSSVFAASGNIVGRSFVRFDQLAGTTAALTAELAVARGETSVLQSLYGLPPWIIGDSFSRADNATALGTANTGQVWTSASGGWKIANKAGQGQSAANNVAVMEAGAADHWVTITMAFPDTSGTRAIIARYADASNFYRYGVFAGVIKLQKVVGGVTTDLATIPGTPSSGSSFGIQCAGSTIKLYRNNMLVATVTDAALLSGTKVGMQDNKGDTRYSMMAVRMS